MNHNDTFLTHVKEHGGDNAARLGPYASFTLANDPRHMLFTMARYKFCAKMLHKYDRIVDFGCGDGNEIPLLLQNVNRVTGVDIIPALISYNRQNNKDLARVDYLLHNIIESPLTEKFDAAISMDVIEHIAPEDEADFLKNIALSIKEYGACIIGTPNITASEYAGIHSKREHINLKSHETLYASLHKHFHNVFLFSMNDEVLHTGFHAMGHYIIALSVCPKR